MTSNMPPPDTEHTAHTEHAEHTEPRPKGLDSFFNAVRDLGLTRDTEDKWLAGVCSGIARRLGVDPVIVRALLLLLVILGGVGITAYLIAWALLPDRNSGDILAERGIRHGEGGAVALLVIIGFVVFGTISDHWWVWTLIIPSALLVWWLVSSARAGRSPEEMNRQAQQFAGRVTGTVQGWGGSPPPGQTSPHGMGPGRTGAVTTALPPRVVRARRRSGGFLVTLLTAGLALLAYGAGSWATTTRHWTTSPELIGVCAALAVVGLVLVAVGILGWRAPLATFAAVALAAVALVGTVAPTTFLASGAGDRMWVPATSSLQDSYRLGMGEATLDLRGLTPTAAAGRTVSASLNMGQLNVMVPTGLTVRVNASTGVGNVDTRRADGTRQQDSGPGARENVTIGPGEPNLVLDARVGMGEIRITEVK